MEVRRAGWEDLDRYQAFSRAAQERIAARGLGQYVPAAHPEYDEAVRGRVRAGTLYGVWAGDEVLGYFVADTTPSPWWPADGMAALYLAGMVVGPAGRGRGVGPAILAWCEAEARRRGCRCVRLDCHAGNPWLGAYYEAHGFKLQGRLEQHPGYFGCLYELPVIFAP